MTDKNTLRSILNKVSAVEEDGNTPKSWWYESFAAQISPDDGVTGYDQYAGNMVAFCKEVLRVKLTPAQEEFIHAVDKYSVVIVKSATGVGKTFALSCIALAWYKTWKRSKTYTAAAPPEANLRDLLWGELGSLVESRPHVFEGDEMTRMRLSRTPKEFIIGVSIPASADDRQIETRASGKHAEYLLYELDEADGIPDAFIRGAEGCLSGDADKQKLVLCFNPKEASGLISEMIFNEKAHVITMSAFDHPNVVSGDDLFPGAVSRAKTIERINQWCEPVLPGEDFGEDEVFQLPSFLVGTTAVDGRGNEYPPLRAGTYRIVDDQFYYKVLGDFPPGGHSLLFRQRWIDEAVSRWVAMTSYDNRMPVPPRGIQPVGGIDVGGSGPDNSTEVWMYGIWASPPEIYTNEDSDKSAQRSAESYVHRNARGAYIDATGLGDHYPYTMARHGREKFRANINAIPVKVGERAPNVGKVECALLRDEAYWNLREAFREGNIAIPPADYNDACKRLHEALRIMTYADDNRKRIKVMDKKTMRKKLKRSPDELEALMLVYAPESSWMGGI